MMRVELLGRRAGDRLRGDGRGARLSAIAGQILGGFLIAFDPRGARLARYS